MDNFDKEVASLFQNVLPWSFAALTLLFLNVYSQTTYDCFFYLYRGLGFNLRPQCFQITMLLTFSMFGHERSHGEKFPKYSRTSFSGIVHPKAGGVRISVLSLRWKSPLDIVVGSIEAPSKAFLLLFLLPNWLKLNHLRSWMECGFWDIFCRICSTVAETIGVTNNTANFGAKKMFRKLHLKLLRWCSVRGTNKSCINRNTSSETLTSNCEQNNYRKWCIPSEHNDGSRTQYHWKNNTIYCPINSYNLGKHVYPRFTCLESRLQSSGYIFTTEYFLRKRLPLLIIMIHAKCWFSFVSCLEKAKKKNSKILIW